MTTTAQIDFAKVKEAAEGYRADMTRFLRALIKAKGMSCQEEEKAKLIQAEMVKLGYTRAEIDPLGNILGYMGTGETLIAFDGHIDTVGVGNIDNWTFDPFDGYEDDVNIGGRGASDQLGGVVSAVYGAKIAKDLDLLSDRYTILVTGTVQEEDCDGMNWLYIIEECDIKPKFVVSTEPTDNGIYRGHRGRMEIRVDVAGVSCHGSAPERGDNAIYKMAEILPEVRDLNDRLLDNDFLGKGTVTTSEIFFTSPSRCAVADSCSISLDRRLTDGETWQSAIKEIEELPSVKKYDAKVSLYNYKAKAWTGLEYGQECYFPTWVIPEDSPEVQAAAKAHQAMYGEPRIDKWTFSTNGVAIAGRHGIPVIGVGPGQEVQAHAPNEINWKDDLVKCAAILSVIPTIYCDTEQA
jgi:putative selenium metabolism hydrolase